MSRFFSLEITLKAVEFQPCSTCIPPSKATLFPMYAGICQALVRFLAYRRIKPHAPPLVQVPVNSFEF